MLFESSQKNQQNENDLEKFSKKLDEVFDEKNLEKKKKEFKEKKVFKDDTVIREAVKQIDDENNAKKLKILGWIATTLSLIGIVLNAYLIIWCWAVWVVSDFIWIYWAIKKKFWYQVVLWVLFIFANLYGWYIWATM